MFDKRDLDLAVRQQLRPVLKRAGFSRFVRRNAWRITPTAVDVVSVQLAREEVDLDFNIKPSRTFFVLMACCPRRMLPARKHKRTGQLIPAKLPVDYECTHRYGLNPPIEIQRQWEASRDGSNLPRLVREMIEHVVIDGLPWFERCHAEFDM